MKDDKRVAAVLRLQKLATELKTAYGKAARHVSDAFRPLEAVVAEIGETWRPSHYAEALRDGNGEAARAPSCFVHERLVNGDEVDYTLCVARGPDRKCGFYVSVCKYHMEPSDNGNGSAKPEDVTIKSTSLVPPGHLPVPLRIKILDVLDPFAGAYDEHVRNARNGLLSGVPEQDESGPEVDTAEVVASDEPGGDPMLKSEAAADATELIEKTAEVAEAVPAVAEEAVEAEEIPEAVEEKPEDSEEVSEVDKKKVKATVKKGRKTAVTSPDSDVPLEAWFPTRR